MNELNPHKNPRKGWQPRRTEPSELRPSYLDRAGIKLDLREVESTIREKPVQAAAIAAAAGFLFGGGMGTRWGAAMLTFAGRKATRDAAANLVSGMVQNAVR
jgi:hypothetical protein